jgi:RNA polymerase sigma-70 factor (ECF subfamily)
MTETRELLMRWHAGHEEALATIVEREADWIAAHVRRRLGPLLRRRHETQDIVQMTLVEVLRGSPRFVVSDRAHLRALLAKMVENVLRMQAHHDQAQKRDLRRETPPRTGETVLHLDPASDGTRPEDAAARTEMRDWVRLALELLEPDDRDVVLLREFEALSFAEIGARLRLSEDAARMRHRRAMPKLAQTLVRLRDGRLGELVG